MNKYIIGMMIGVLGSGLSVLGSGAQAETITKPQKPLVYEYNLKGPLTVESEIITTTGTIKTISAFADSEGEVRLEISANGGSAYTRITNGQPLSDRFIPGNRLRVRANIAQGGVLKKITLWFTDSSGVSRMFYNPSLAKFKSHKPIYISGASEELFNYPLKIKIEKEIYSQGIYFTAADAESPLDYYVEEEGLSPRPQGVPRRSEASPEGDAVEGQGTVPVVWVKVPEIPKDGAMIYLYYGQKEGLSPQGTVPLLDAQGTNPSLDGKKVFPFFDDFTPLETMGRQEKDMVSLTRFNTSGLDEKKWQIRGGLKKECSVKDGYLRLRDCTVVSRNFKMKERILEFKARAEENAAIQAVVRGSDTGHFILPFEEIVYSSAYPGAEHTIAINDVAKLNIGKAIQPLTDYIYKVILNTEGIIFERYGQDYTKQAEIRFLNSYRDEAGYIGLKADGALPAGGRVYFDWVRVRPYTEVEPKILKAPGDERD